MLSMWKKIQFITTDKIDFIMDDLQVIKVEFVNTDSIKDRECICTLNNGTEVHISSCYESWQQWGGTRDELSTTAVIAECVNDWLHGIGEPPAEVYDYIDGGGE
jgi:hypothetical protein